MLLEVDCELWTQICSIFQDIHIFGESLEDYILIRTSRYELSMSVKHRNLNKDEELEQLLYCLIYSSPDSMSELCLLMILHSYHLHCILNLKKAYILHLSDDSIFLENTVFLTHLSL